MYTNEPHRQPVEGVLVWGELLWDLFPDGDQLGGAPTNVAWHLALLGHRPRLVSRIGDDALGERALVQLGRAGVDLSLVGVDGERATGVVEIEVVDGEPRYRLVAGRAWERIAFDAAVASALGAASAVVYGTLSQRTAEGAAAWRAMMAAVPAGCLRVCDPNLRPGHVDTAAVAEALALADVAKLNDREVELCRERLGIADPVAWLLDRGARLVAVTHGPDGATLHGGGATVRIAGSTAAPGGDNVGCGDAFLAVLVHGLLSGWALPRVGEVACRWATAVAGRRGGTPTFEPDEIAALLG